jgi:hypothetical protein
MIDFGLLPNAVIKQGGKREAVRYMLQVQLVTPSVIRGYCSTGGRTAPAYT